MTDQEFWKQLKESFRTHETQKTIPFLIQRAEKDCLNLPVVVDKAQKKEKYHAIYLGNMKLMQCATSIPASPGVYSDPIQPGQTIRTIPLKGLFQKLKKEGYAGIAFLHQGGLTAFDWKDFTSHPNKPFII